MIFFKFEDIQFNRINEIINDLLKLYNDMVTIYKECRDIYFHIN